MSTALSTRGVINGNVIALPTHGVIDVTSIVDASLLLSDTNGVVIHIKDLNGSDINISDSDNGDVDIKGY